MVPFNRCQGDAHGVIPEVGYHIEDSGRLGKVLSESVVFIVRQHGLVKEEDGMGHGDFVYPLRFYTVSFQLDLHEPGVGGFACGRHTLEQDEP